MRMHVAIALLVLLFGSAAEAAGRGKPLVTTPLRDGADLATRIRTDPQVAAIYTEAFRQVRSDIPLSGVEDTARYVETLAPCTAPDGEYTVSRLLDGAVGTHVRGAVSEGSLCDPNHDGQPVIFLHCGNVVRKNQKPKRRKEPVRHVELVQQRASWEDLAMMPGEWMPIHDPQMNSAYVACPSDQCLGPKLIDGAIGAAQIMLLPVPKFKQSINTVNEVMNTVTVPEAPKPPAPDPGGPKQPAPDPLGNDSGGPADPDIDNW